jgi:hypothetical protein
MENSHAAQESMAALAPYPTFAEAGQTIGEQVPLE